VAAAAHRVAGATLQGYREGFKGVAYGQLVNALEAGGLSPHRRRGVLIEPLAHGQGGAFGLRPGLLALQPACRSGLRLRPWPIYSDAGPAPARTLFVNEAHGQVPGLPRAISRQDCGPLPAPKAGMSQAGRMPLARSIPECRRPDNRWANPGKAGVAASATRMPC
jgi:hypothetical protein